MTRHQEESPLDSWLRAAEISDRRTHPRVAPQTDEATLFLRVQVVDESEGGLGIILEPGWEPNIGSRVEVYHQGFPQWGEVRFVNGLPDGKQRVGLKWVD